MKSKKHIILVVNPISGDSPKDSLEETVTELAAKKNLALRIYKTTGNGDKKAILDLIKEEVPWRILVAGGDGTISMVGECILGSSIGLGILPLGSANGLATNFDLPPGLEAQIEIALSPVTMKIDTLKINGKLCLHIGDLGINAELIENYENSGIRGKFGYLIQSIPTLINTQSPFDFKIQTKKGSVDQSGVLLAITNANKFGTGANINPEGIITDGKFEILIFKNLDFVEIMKTIQDNPDLSSEFVHTLSTEKAVITTKTEVPFQIDGEFMGKTSKVNVQILRESLLVVVPKIFYNLHKNPKHEY